MCAIIYLLFFFEIAVVKLETSDMLYCEL